MGILSSVIRNTCLKFFLKTAIQIEMSTVVLSGSVPLQGTSRVEVTSDKLTATCRVTLKGASGPLKGTIVVSEITPGTGFGLSSTSPQDVGVILYFDVVE